MQVECKNFPLRPWFPSTHTHIYILYPSRTPYNTECVTKLKQKCDTSFHLHLLILVLEEIISLPFSARYTLKHYTHTRVHMSYRTGSGRTRTHTHCSRSFSRWGTACDTDDHHDGGINLAAGHRVRRTGHRWITHQGRITGESHDKNTRFSLLRWLILCKVCTRLENIMDRGKNGTKLVLMTVAVRAAVGNSC